MTQTQTSSVLTTTRRMNRNRRIIVHYPRFICFLLTIVLLGIFIGNCVAPAKADEPIRIKTLTHYETITVAFGDTLLGIAEEYSPDENVRRFMCEIMDHNDLDDTAIVAGETLSIPIYTIQEETLSKTR